MQSPFTSSSTGTAVTPSAPSHNISDLGKLVSEHPGNVKAFFVTGGALIFGGLALVGYNKVQPDLLWLVGAAMLIPLGMASVAWGLVQGGQDAKRYEKGLWLKDRKRTATLRWEDIESITQKLTRVYVNRTYTNTTHIYWIKGRDGQVWKLDDKITDVAVIGEDVQNQVLRLQLPGMLQDFKAGRPVQFGELSFDLKGITHNHNQIAWTDFKSIDFKNGVLRVHKPKDGVRGLLTGGSITIQVAELPNFHALIAFIENLPAYEKALD